MRPKLLSAMLALVFLPLVTGCGLIMNKAASALSKSGTSATSDNDPELVETAFAYQIKLQEGLLESVPHNRDLLVATCKLSIEYGYAFYQGKAEMLGEAHHDEVVVLRDKALNMYLRGKKYCLRALDEQHEHSSAELVKDQDTMEKAVKRFNDKDDVEMLYWTAATWGAAISLGRDKPMISIDFPVVRALANQALALDESWNKGAIHELMITLDSLPEFLGGSPEAAKKHFDRAVELQKGLSPGPYVSYALGVAQPAQDKEQFLKLLDQALAIDSDKDPDNRLVTILTQRKAKALKEQIDTLFVGKAPLATRH